jgi:hypothetical protein
VVHQFADGLEVVELGLRHGVEQGDGAAGMLDAAAGVAERGLHLLAAVHHHEECAHLGADFRSVRFDRSVIHGVHTRRKATLAAQPALAASRIAKIPYKGARLWAKSKMSALVPI